MGRQSPSRPARWRHRGPEWERLSGWPVRSRRRRGERPAPPRHLSAASVVGSRRFGWSRACRS